MRLSWVSCVCSDREWNERSVHEGEAARVARAARCRGAARDADDADVLCAVHTNRQGAHESNQCAGAAKPARQTMSAHRARQLSC